MERIKFTSMNPNTNSKKIICYAVLVLIYLTVSYFKIITINKELLLHKEEPDTLLFFTESAFQYRYAKMIAEGNRVPEIDIKAQWPEGIKPYSELTMLMPMVHGYTYRIFIKFFPKVPFHIYLFYFICFYTSLTVCIVFIISNMLWKNLIAGLISTIFYATSWSSFIRTMPQGGFFTYNLEDFTLLLIFCSFMFFVSSIKETRSKYSLLLGIISGLFILLSFWSWHFAKFYFYVFTIAVTITAVFCVLRNRHYNLCETIGGFVIIPTIGSLFLPVTRLAVFSLPMFILYGLFLYFFLQKKFSYNSIGKKLLLLCLILICCATVIFIRNAESEYTHVWSLFIDKLHFLGVKPESPSSLSFESRALWTGDFNTTNVLITIFYLSSLLIWGLLGGYSLFIKKILKKNEEVEKLAHILLFLVFIGFGILYVMIVRLHVFISFFLSVLCGCLFLMKFPKIIKSFIISFLVMTILWEIYEIPNYKGIGLKNLIMLRYFQHEDTIKKIPKFVIVELKEWIQKNTNSENAFLTSFETGPIILLSADRPIIIHSKFETSIMRDKVKEFTFALYNNDEKKFFTLCKKYNVSYFLYQPFLLFEKGIESKRYQAEALNLLKTSLCYRFHFQPESFKHFQLVYQNMNSRVYKIVKNNILVRELPYIALYDVNLYNQKKIDNYFNEESVSAVVEKYYRGIEWFVHGIKFTANGEYDETIKCNLKGSEEGYPEYRFYSEIGNIYALKKEYKKAIPYLEKAIKLAPEESDLQLTLAQLYYLTGEIQKSLKEAEKLLKNNPQNNKALLIISTIKAERY
ncbi:MAG: tetratricopeptide repeat protein [Elusimicrobiota bacterium]